MILQVQLSLNCFTSCESSINESADLVSWFPRAAFFNHSCQPNLAKTFSDFELVLRTTRPVAPGEELTISYTSFLTPFYDRSLYLQKNYGFKCDCRLCKYETSKTYFRNLHKGFKKKINSMPDQQFSGYFQKSFPRISELESRELICVRGLVEEAFRSPGQSAQNEKCSQSQINLFLKRFIDHNYKHAARIADHLLDKDRQTTLAPPASEEDRVHQMLQILNRNHARVGDSHVGQFIKEISKIFGKKNLVIVGFMSQMDLHFLEKQRFGACYEMTLWHCRVMKEFIEITGEKNWSVIGLVHFKLAKLERLADRVDQAFIFAGFGLEILKSYYSSDELADLQDIWNESFEIIQRMGINLEQKSKALRQKYFPSD